MVIAAFLAPLIATGFPSSASAADIGLSVRIGDRYRGERLAFRQRPQMVVVPNTQVYYIQNSDADVYRYGRFYYANESGRWYRSRDYRGPWIYVRARTVPRQIYTVPADYRRGWRGDANYWRSRDYDRDWDRRDRSDNNNDRRNDRGNRGGY